MARAIHHPVRVLPFLVAPLPYLFNAEVIPFRFACTRKDIAAKLNKALQSGSDDGGVSGADATATPEVPGITTPTQPAMDAQQAQHRDLALSLSSMISQHVPHALPIHKTDVEARIHALLESAPAKIAPGADPTEIAQQIAQARRHNEVERQVLLDAGDRDWTVDRLRSACLGGYKGLMRYSSTSVSQFSPSSQLKFDFHCGSGNPKAPSKFLNRVCRFFRPTVQLRYNQFAVSGSMLDTSTVCAAFAMS